MSEQRTVIEPATGKEISLSEAVKTDPENIKKLRAEKKAKLANIVDRGVVADRLDVPLPDNLYGEWIPNDKAEIHRMEALGFKIDSEYATKRTLHDGADGRSIVGDTVYMVCERETKEILNEIRRERYEAINGKPGEVHKTQAEEKTFATQLDRTGMPLIQESRDRAAKKADIVAALGGEASRPGSPIK